MIISGFTVTFLVGCFGGIMGEALNWYSRRESPRLPQYLKGLRYWITTLVMILVGGFLATLYGIEEENAVLVAYIGLTTPAILKSFAQAVPESNIKTLGKSPSIIDFVAGR